MVGSRPSYCNDKHAYFLAHPTYGVFIIIILYFYRS